jgi:hypothetical protein
MTHYQVLELPESASATDIRRAYRRLVLLTHPDRTPDPVAHARYLAVNAAYEVLSDAARRTSYDNSLHQQPSFPPVPPSTGRARDAVRQARRAGYVRRPAEPLTVRYAAEYARALRLARPCLIISLVLGIALVADLILATERPEKVVDAQTIFRTRRADSHHTYSYRTEQGIVAIDAEVPVGTPMLIRRTPLWGKAVSVRFSAVEPAISCDSLYDGPRNLFWIGLVLSALAGLMPFLTADQRLIASLANVVFLSATLLQLCQTTI